MKSIIRLLEIFLKWIKPHVNLIMGIIIGWFGHLVQLKISEEYNRPILNFSLHGFIIEEMDFGGWTMKLVVDQENTGNSNAVYSLTEITGEFPFTESTPLRIHENKSFSLNSQSTRRDTIEVSIPSAFKHSKPLEFSKFKRVGLKYMDLQTKENYSISRDSSETLIAYIIAPEELPKTIDLRKVFGTVNSLTGDSILIRGKHFVTFKGKTYSNFYYPHDSKIKYEIEDEKIYIEYSQSLENPELKPVVYIPDSAIKDYVVLPRRPSLIGDVKSKTEVGDIFTNFEYHAPRGMINSYFCIFK